MYAGFPAKTVGTFRIYGSFRPDDPLTNSELRGKDVKGTRAGLSACKFQAFTWWD